jgi:hypothetical protein
MAIPIVIENNLRCPTACPECGSIDLFVATDGKGTTPTRSNPRGWPETFIGYDCRACGQQLRFPRQL